MASNIPSSLVRDNMKVKLYNEFYNTHQDLYETNRIEYWRKAGMYVEPKMRKWITTRKDPILNADEIENLLNDIRNVN